MTEERNKEFRTLLDNVPLIRHTTIEEIGGSDVFCEVRLKAI
jgi:hypothetical protein